MPTGHCITLKMRLKAVSAKKNPRSPTVTGMTYISPQGGEGNLAMAPTQTLRMNLEAEGFHRLGAGGSAGFDSNPSFIHVPAATQRIKMQAVGALPRNVRRLRPDGGDGLLSDSMDELQTTMVVEVVGPTVDAIEVSGEGTI